MLLRHSLLVRLLTLGAVAVPLVAYVKVPVAHAQDDDDDDSAGGDEGGEGGDEGEEEEAVDPDQPAVTAGGLYTIATYPQSEVERPLSITQKIFEGRLG